MSAARFVLTEDLSDPHPIKALADRGARISVARAGKSIPMAEAIRRGLVKVEEPTPVPEPAPEPEPVVTAEVREPVTAEVRRSKPASKPAPRKRPAAKRPAPKKD